MSETLREALESLSRYTAGIEHGPCVDVAAMEEVVARFEPPEPPKSYWAEFLAWEERAAAAGSGMTAEQKTGAALFRSWLVNDAPDDGRPESPSPEGLTEALTTLIQACRDIRGTCRLCGAAASTFHERSCPVEAAIKTIEPGYAKYADEAAEAYTSADIPLVEDSIRAAHAAQRRGLAARLRSSADSGTEPTHD